MAASVKTPPKARPPRTPLGGNLRPPAPKPSAKPARMTEATANFVSGGGTGRGKGRLSTEQPERKKPGPVPKAQDTPVVPLSMKVPQPLHTWLQRAVFKRKADKETINTQKDVMCLAFAEFLEKEHPELKPDDFDMALIFGADPE